MKAYSVVAHGIYAAIVIALVAFIVLGVVPTKTDGMPLDAELGAECVYEVTTDTEIMVYNISDAVKTSGADARVFVGNTQVTTVSYGNSASVAAAVTKLQNEYPNKTAVLKDSSGKTLRQGMILVEKTGLEMKMYTELRITNYLRYDLQDISVGVNQVAKDGTIQYQVAETPKFDVAPGETHTARVDIEVNYIDSAMIMLAGEKDAMKINLDIKIGGKYLAGIADANITVATSFAPSGAPTVSVTENKISATGPTVSMIPSGTDVKATIGGVEINVKNDGSGFSAVVDAGSEKIVDALVEFYEAGKASGEYSITYNTGGGDVTITMTQEEVATMMEMVSQVLETYDIASYIPEAP